MAQPQKQKPPTPQVNRAVTQRDNRRQPPVQTPVGMATSNPPKPQSSPNKTPWPVIFLAGTASLLLVFFLALAGAGGRTTGAITRAAASPTPALKTTTTPVQAIVPSKPGMTATITSPNKQPAPLALVTATLAPTNSGQTSPTAAPLHVAGQPKSASAMLDVEILGAGYEKWGRPLNQSFCGDFDDNDPVYKFTVPMRVTNNSTRILSDWYAVFYLADGRKPFRTCYYGYGNSASFPPIKPGEFVNVTFAAFVEPQERDKITRVEVGGQELMAKRCFSGQKVVACP